MRLAVAAVVVAVLGLGVGVGVAAARPHDYHDDVEWQIQQQLPDERDYSWVALPTTAPPAGAFVQTAHYADPLRSGQQVLLEYRPFTVYVCSMVPGYTDPGACRGAGKTLLRTVRLHGVVTRYLVGTKSTADPRRTAPVLFDSIRDYVAHAHVAARPDWVPAYAERHLRRIYG